MAVAGWMYFTHQTEWKAYLQDLVSYNDQALLSSIVIIDSMQTETERKAKESTEDNSVGWTKQDAKDMGEIADKVRKQEALTEGELAKSRNKMRKYWKQLMMVSIRQHGGIQQSAANKQIKTTSQRDQFRQHNAALYECSEHGKACGYGICDECPVTQGLQIRLCT